jgi:hypothetical protein
MDFNLLVQDTVQSRPPQNDNELKDFIKGAMLLDHTRD